MITIAADGLLQDHWSIGRLFLGCALGRAVFADVRLTRRRQEAIVE